MNEPSAVGRQSWRDFVRVMRYGRRAVALVWSANKPLTIALGSLTIAAGLLPAGIAFIGQMIIDSIVAVINAREEGRFVDYGNVFFLVGLEAALVAAMSGGQRGQSFCQSLLRVLLNQRVVTLILSKALTLNLAQFEDSQFYDKLNRARQEASNKPLSFVNRTFALAQNTISMISYAVLLLQLSPLAVVILVSAGLPAFFAEAQFSAERFRNFHWHSPLRRMLTYLEVVLAREDYAKEVQLFNLGPPLMKRCTALFDELYTEEKRLARRRDGWGFVLGLTSSGAFYGAYVWVVTEAIVGNISLGEMTMYLMLFRQGQSAVSVILNSVGGLYEDSLYLSSLYDFLEQPRLSVSGDRTHGEDTRAGVVFDDVTFTYPGARKPAVHRINLRIDPGTSVALVGCNGSGKTTLVKLLSALYSPDAGRITFRGVDLACWDHAALREHIAVVFQDFIKYQLTVGENIGAGHVAELHSVHRWKEAATHGKAAKFIEALPKGYETQLGRWFDGGQELSGGQWQRIALSRAFMRSHAEIVVLDEPTSAMDAETEAEVLSHFRSLTKDKIAILISHRFSTVRQADHIVVLDGGRIVEQGSHESLMRAKSHYCRLFELQAEAYR